MNAQPLYSPFGSKDIAAGAQAVNRSSVAALTFLVWDILATLDDEVKLIWPKPKSYPKYIYFLLRYLPVMVQISLLLVGSELTPHFHFTPRDCYIWQIYQGVAIFTIIGLMDAILILRVNAMYHRHHMVRHIVSLLFLLEIIGMSTGLALTLPGIRYDNLCVVIHVPLSIAVYGVSALAFQFCLFLLMLYKFIQTGREAGWRNIPLNVLLMRDGTWAFFLIFGIYIIQFSLFGLNQQAYSGILYAWQMTVSSFCGYHVLLNLNRFANGPSNMNLVAQSPIDAGNGTLQTTAPTNLQFARDIEEVQRSYLDPQP